MLFRSCSIVLEDVLPMFFFLILVVGGVFEELYWWVVPVVFFFVFRPGKPVSVLEVNDIIIELVSWRSFGACWITWALFKVPTVCLVRLTFGSSVASIDCVIRVPAAVCVALLVSVPAGVSLRLLCPVVSLPL